MFNIVDGSFTYEQAKRLKDERVWRDISRVSIGDAANIWLQSLPRLTAKNYNCGISFLSSKGVLDLDLNLQMFSLINQDSIIDNIKSLDGVSECTKQARAACFISFTRFLSRRTEGLIKRAIPCREGTTKTFFKVREKVKTNAMSHKQWSTFLCELGKINKRDCLIAKLLIQGGKRMSEVLALTTDQINYNACEITFDQAKTKGYDKQTVITYPQMVIDELMEYLNGRTGLVFTTKTGLRVMPNQIAVTFASAGKRAKVPFKVTPHVLRASTVTYLKKEGFADSEIMKVTGHASAEMVHAYDKSERADNPTKMVSLI